MKAVYGLLSFTSLLATILACAWIFNNTGLTIPNGVLMLIVFTAGIAVACYFSNKQKRG